MARHPHAVGLLPAEFVNESGQEEDRDAARKIQASATSPANTHFTFGYFEKAIVNFHQHLALHLGD